MQFMRFNDNLEHFGTTFFKLEYIYPWE